MAHKKTKVDTVQAQDCYDPQDYVMVHKDYLAKLQRIEAERAAIPVPELGSAHEQVDCADPRTCQICSPDQSSGANHHE